MSEYEREKEENIARNKLLLADLGLDKPFFEPKETRQAPTKKRKAPADKEPSDRSSPAKVSRVVSEGESSELRRSQRNVGKSIDYKGPLKRPDLPPVRSSIDDHRGPFGREFGKRTQNPKRFGHIPGIAVGTWWESREGCSVDAIHAPWVGGIAPGPNGAYSIALSGGYDDDVDLGYAFTYTGSGGRDLKGTAEKPKNLRTAPQSSDQTFDNPFNRALLRSSETKNLVRVIRGFKLKSRYAPTEGYRYDGLYTVEKAWIEKGLNPQGYKVCKFAFKRLGGQPALPIRDIGT